MDIKQKETKEKEQTTDKHDMVNLKNIKRRQRKKLLMPST